MNKFQIEITFPVLNEERRLRLGFERAIEFVQAHDLPICFAIADNGSTDTTFQIAQELVRKYPGTRTVKVSRRGVGLALKESWSSSDCEIVGYMDVDLATSLHHLLEVRELMRDPGVDLVTGSRLISGAQVRGRKLSRELASRCFNRIVQLLLKVPFTDGMCGFKFIRRAAFLRVFRECPPMTDGWFFNTEFMVKADWLGLKLREIPAQWEDDGDSRVRLLQLSQEYLREIFRLRQERSHFLRR